VKPGWGQTSNCAMHSVVVERLKADHEESLRIDGVSSAGNVLEIHVNPTKGTFTVLMVRPDRFACVLSTGTEFVQRQIEPTN